MDSGQKSCEEEMSNPLKVIQVSGILPSEGSQRFVAQLYSNYCNVCDGVWEIALSDVTITNSNKAVPTAANPAFISIHTNFVNGEFTPNHSRNFIPMQKLIIKGNEDALHNFDHPRWFQVNSPSLNFEAYTQRYANTGDRLKTDLFCSMTFLLRRIR